MKQDFVPVNVHLNELLFTVGIGTWDWEVSTGKVIYSDAWAKTVGYEVTELSQVVETWERMVLPEDLPYANAQIQRHLSGEAPTYEAEFRMVCKDGRVIWAQDKGRVTEHDKDGKALRFMGVLQNVTRLKDAEFHLLENQETLDLAVNVAELGIWDWDIAANTIHYNDEYLKMLGYSQDEMTGSMEEWKSMNHPDDLPRSMQLLNAYIAGTIPSYECEIRMKHRDESYLWTNDVGRIVARDADGNPTRLIGGHLNIDRQKCSEHHMTEALEALEHNKLHLESEIEKRTRGLVEQDNSLRTVNQISKLLLTANADSGFEDMVQDCLCMLGETIHKNRVYIWKDYFEENGDLCCAILYEWFSGATAIQATKELSQISYQRFPTFTATIKEDRCLNSFVRDLAESERNILSPKGVKTILIAPVTIGGKRWGFIGVDNCESETLFTSTEENMLLMSGSMIANAIERTETDAKLREVEERTQLMLNATPLCCNLWTTELQNMQCNDEAVRLFELSSQQEYLDHFGELSPERQPCGRLSAEYAAECVIEAFRDGYKHMEWMHQKFDGTPIPAEITLVRVKYKDSFIVAGYTRDLREQKAMLAQLQSQEDDLRTARDEALLNSKAKSNFLANMSHEIRTPMNAITGLSEIILRENADEKTAEYAKGIKDASGSLLNIINSILDISKIESGKLEIFHSQYELSSVLNDVITISRMRLGNKPLMFLTNIDSQMPARLIGDEIRLKQILINLLSNAIKFTQEGYLALRVSVTMEGNQAILRFSVKDSGVGIKEKDLERLFAEFERVNTTKNRSIEGTGLGLAISKQLCEMMGGQIEVQSDYGKGSEFIVTIPQECPSYERLAQVQGIKKVLLYEPRVLYRSSISETLENLGCDYVSCENQSELYDNISRMPYDYILTASLHLKKVQSIADKKKLTALIAAFVDYSEPKALDEKPDKAYTILFPVNCLQLASLLNGQHDGTDFLRHSVADANFTAPSARILVVDDNPVNLCVAEGLMAPYQFVIDTAVNGLEAVEMVRQTQYDLVFMDHMMPEMDGIDATVAIRALKEKYYQSLPIIALTANALVGTREMFIREGMNDFLAKPIEIKKLNHTLLKWLPKAKIVNSTHREETTADEQTLSWEIEGLNTAQGILSVGGSKENYVQILSVYCTDGEKKCSSLLRHVTRKNISAFRTEVHSLKSASATIGALAVSSMAAKLEEAALKDDSSFINDNLDEFLTRLDVILQAIRISLQRESFSRKQETSADNLMDSEAMPLKEALDALRDAAELANIGQIEAIMDQLQRQGKSEAVAQELLVLRECMAVFDYDGMLECVTRLILQQSVPDPRSDNS